MGLSAPSGSKAARASPLRDSLRSPKGRPLASLGLGCRLSTLLMGLSAPSGSKAARASPLRDSLRSPKGRPLACARSWLSAQHAINGAQRPLHRHQPAEPPPSHLASLGLAVGSAGSCWGSAPPPAAKLPEPPPSETRFARPRATGSMTPRPASLALGFAEGRTSPLA
jgi:hypothetical protein